MRPDFNSPAKVVWHSDEEEAPQSWADATAFGSLREALNAIVNGTPQTGHPRLRSNGRVYAPHDVEDLWREDRTLGTPSY